MRETLTYRGRVHAILPVVPTHCVRSRRASRSIGGWDLRWPARSGIIARLLGLFVARHLSDCLSKRYVTGVRSASVKLLADTVDGDSRGILYGFARPSWKI